MKEFRDSDDIQTSPSNCGRSVLETIHWHTLAFFEKRGASGDTRTCGEYSMESLYLTDILISKNDLADEKFLSRFRRCG